MATPPKNPADRKSSVIKKNAAANFHHAVWVSIAAGPLLTHYVTINVTNTSLSKDLTSAAFTKLRSRKFAPWLRDAQQSRNMHPTPPTYVWVIEAPGRRNFAGSRTEDIHIHWALYIPPGLVRTFYRKLKIWVAECFAGISNHRHVVRRKAIKSILGLKRYMSKGVSKSVGKRNGIRTSPQGTVTGRRSGFSVNLGPKMRKQDHAVRQAYEAAKGILASAADPANPDPAGSAQKAGRAAYRAAGGGQRF